MSIYKFANNLRKIRENKKLSQEDLAHLSGVNRRSVLRLENGLIKEPTIDTLLKLSASLEVDLVDLYIKDIYESHYLYKDLLSSFDILCGFKPKEEILLLEKKLNILEADPNFKGKDYELALMRLFIKNLKTPILISLQEEFEDLTSTRLNKNNLLTKDLSFLEARLLLNICNKNKSYKEIEREDILNNLITKRDKPIIVIMAYNILINRMYVNGTSKEALELADKSIQYAIDNHIINSYALLYYLKFLCFYEIGDDRYINSLNCANMFSSHLDNCMLSKIIDKKSKIVFGD
ncbi:helix-turn-helix transcriptional regulator [Anaerococcus sp. NML200537]|uniref:helix-turn-helix domain-containing protein n=1 Tax=Anaerococcus sp. NML200537 TaxID=2954485 RepID=UPI0022374ED6|nr:helix-turn-helix transcriptional regulator [Anaerococcus sp. NML200537]MCW6702042.1 helix-turn-helix transcriptional regulator [Anaerococcus sp. NML200537]